MMPLLETTWTCPACGEGIEVLSQVTEQHAEESTVTTNATLVPDSTEDVYAHMRGHGFEA